MARRLCMLPISLVVFSLGLAIAWAVESSGEKYPGVRKFKDYTPQQIRDMPEAERQKSVPMKYIFASQKGLATDGALAIAMDLNALMYPGIGDFASAVKMFQSDIGEAPSGVLTVSQISTLTVRAEFQKLGPISFPTPHHSHFSPNFASAAGTMKIIDERIAWPVNYATITCYRAEAYCERWSAYMEIPKEDDWIRMYSIQEPTRETFKVTRWDGKMIDAIPVEPPKCRAVTLSLNFVTNEFYEIARNAGPECDVLGVKMPQLEKPRISQLVDGKEIVAKELADLQRKAYGYLSSDFRKQVEQANLRTKPD